MAFLDSLMRPIRAFRTAYVPLVMVYFAYGALGLIDVTRDMWIKESLTLTSVGTGGDRRLADAALDREDGVRRTRGLRADLRIAAPGLYPVRRSVHRIRACSCSPGAAGGWLDVRAAGSALRARRDIDRGRHRYSGRRRRRDVDRGGAARRCDRLPRKTRRTTIKSELGMVQVLGRLSLSAGIVTVAGLSGVLAGWSGRETVFLLGLVIPADLDQRHVPDRAGKGRAAADRLAHSRRWHWPSVRLVLALALGGIPLAQEFIFVLSMAVICTMLVFVTRDLDQKIADGDPLHHHHHLRISCNANGRRRLFLVDARYPEVRRGSSTASLRQTGAVLAIIAMWVFAKQLTEYSVTETLVLDRGDRFDPVAAKRRALFRSA